MNISYTADAKQAVENMSLEVQKIQAIIIFNSICEWKNTIQDENFWFSADDAIETYAMFLKSRFNLHRRDVAPYA
jgi:hypothetical protein